MIPVPSHLLISLFSIVKLRVEKSWSMEIPFDACPISVMVLLLIVMLAVEVVPSLIMAIPLSLPPTIVLSVATSVR